MVFPKKPYATRNNAPLKNVSPRFWVAFTKLSKKRGSFEWLKEKEMAISSSKRSDFH